MRFPEQYYTYIISLNVNSTNRLNDRLIIFYADFITEKYMKTQSSEEIAADIKQNL